MGQPLIPADRLLWPKTLADRDYRNVYESSLRAIEATSDQCAVLHLNAVAAWAAKGLGDREAVLRHCEFVFDVAQRVAVDASSLSTLITVLAIMAPVLIRRGNVDVAQHYVSCCRAILADRGDGALNLLFDTLVGQWETTFSVELH